MLNRYFKVLKLIIIPIFFARHRKFFIFEGITHLILNDEDLNAEGFNKFFCKIYGVDHFHMIFVDVSADVSFKRMVNRGDEIYGDDQLLVEKYRIASQIQKKLVNSLSYLNKQRAISVTICHLNGNRKPEQNIMDLKAWFSANVICCDNTANFK